jgi:hypothetical protein
MGSFDAKKPLSKISCLGMSSFIQCQFSPDSAKFGVTVPPKYYHFFWFNLRVFALSSCFCCKKRDFFYILT